MNFIDAIKTSFSKYVDFDGRAPRAEYWQWVLFVFLGNLCLPILWDSLGVVFALATLLPSFAASARRLHDIDRSGWWQLLFIIPVLGWIFWIVWCCRIGDEGPNRFGDEPFSAYRARWR